MPTVFFMHKFRTKGQVFLKKMICLLSLLLVVGAAVLSAPVTDSEFNVETETGLVYY